MDIVHEIGMPAMLGQLAEECCELGQAALKYQRILMRRNPTPVTEKQVLANIREEAEDVRYCLALIDRAGIETVDLEQTANKKVRWEQRIRNAKENHCCD